MVHSRHKTRSSKKFAELSGDKKPTGGLPTITRNGKPLILPEFTPAQRKVFEDTEHQFIVFCKGRRVGGTLGAAIFCIEQLLRGKQILWVDTRQANLPVYYIKYFLPYLNQIKKDAWNWKKSKNELQLLNGNMCMASAEKPEGLEGMAYDIIICNEAGIILKNDYLWFNALSPMVIDRACRCFFVGTPKGKVSASGSEHLYFSFYKRGLSDNPDWAKWKTYTATSWDNPHLPKEEIQRYIDETPSLIRDQEIYAKFSDINNEVIFKPEWFSFISKKDIKDLKFDTKIISLDTAFKDNETNDFSVGSVWGKVGGGGGGGAKYYLLDMMVERCAFPDLMQKTIELYNFWLPEVVLIEDRASGQSLIQMLQQSTTMPVRPIPVDRDKTTRAAATTPLFEHGQVLFVVPGPADESAAYPDYITMAVDQLTVFPFGEFDDIVDSISQALNFWRGDAPWQDIPKIFSTPIHKFSATVAGYNANEINFAPIIGKSKAKTQILEGYWK